VQGSIQRDVLQVETDDPVERGEFLTLEVVEHAGRDPLVAACSQRGVGHLVIEDGFDVDP
jgi:hypothetical protein